MFGLELETLNLQAKQFFNWNPSNEQSFTSRMYSGPKSLALGFFSVGEDRRDKGHERVHVLVMAEL